MGLLAIGQLERIRMMNYRWDHVSEQSKKALSRHFFHSVVVDTNLTGVDSLYIFKGSTELDLTFEGTIDKSSQFTIMAPPPGPSLVKLRLKGYTDPMLQSPVHHLHRDVPLCDQQVAKSLDCCTLSEYIPPPQGHFGFPPPFLEPLNVLHGVRGIVPTHPTLNISRLCSIQLSLTKGDTSDPGTLKWWVDNLKGATDTRMEKTLLDVKLYTHQLHPLAVQTMSSLI
ncbi:hypothetical protein IW261DRAFT_1574177 [Armillaria novae-zelandiae]|uniref:Uncharacterized protein n=1 Tax=Armillaria novae-zelandiae TaxID=153914 RepID=A0AA39U5J7_9AGAR|nr:hypothetical protein IW261DRAFT_1574177 [Armillaria novae-zelandiae]